MSGEESQKLWQAAAAVSDRCVCIRLPEHPADGGRLELSPWDFACRGLDDVPMLWCYKETLDVDAILTALEKTLEDYPVLCGRFTSPPTAIDLNNAGVPVHVCTATDAVLSDAISHMPNLCEESPRTFALNVYEQLFPAPLGLRSDTSPDTPLLLIKVTVFRSGGTAIGVLAHHGVVDAEAQISFVANWSRVFRGLPMEPAPIHERHMVNNLETSDLPASERPSPTLFMVATGKEQIVDETLGLWPTIYGDHCCLIPVSKVVLQEWKSIASVGLPTGQYVSTDDVVTARVWRSLCAVRCNQVGLSAESDETTILARPCNIRQRTNPVLDAGYFGNAVDLVFTELSVRDLLTGQISTVASLLRASLKANNTPQQIAARAKSYRQQMQAGCKRVACFGSWGLNFFISSWNCDWGAANFRAKPICFGPGYVEAVCSYIVAGPDGDGVSVYASGPRQHLDQFIHLLLQKDP